MIKRVLLSGRLSPKTSALWFPLSLCGVRWEHVGCKTTTLVVPLGTLLLPCYGH